MIKESVLASENKRVNWSESEGVHAFVLNIAYQGHVYGVCSYEQTQEIS